MLRDKSFLRLVSRLPIEWIPMLCRLAKSFRFPQNEKVNAGWLAATVIFIK